MMGRPSFSSSAADGRKETMTNSGSDDQSDHDGQSDHDDEDSAFVLHVDGNNNVRLALPKGAFVAVGIEPSDHDILGSSDIPGHYEARFGAASGKYIADIAGLPRDPHEWPAKVHGVARWLATAVPYATQRIRDEREGGQSRSGIFCDDLAVARGEDPEEVRRRLKASAAPSVAPHAVDKAGAAAARLLSDPDADRVIEVASRYVDLVIPDALTTVGVNWGVTSPKGAVLRINCGTQLVFSCERQDGALTWWVYVPVDSGPISGKDLAADFDAVVGEGCKGPPANVGLRVPDSAIDRMLQSENLLAAARAVTEAQTARRLLNPGWHHTTVYELLLRIIGDG